MTTATVLEIPPFADYERLLREKASSRHYHKFSIPKYKRVKGKKVQIGQREIVAPAPELKRLQRAIISELLRYGVGAHKAAHAYIKGRSIKTNAQRHLRKARRLRIDIQNFFPSIRREHVIPYLPKTVPKPLITIITNWCFLNGALPQGAPSSPILSNVAMFRADCVLTKLVESWRHISRRNSARLPERKIRTEPIVYTRYCDDLIFSSNYPYLYDIGRTVTSVLRNMGLTVNEKKTHCAHRASRQVVTGIVVNDKLSVPKNTRNLLRAQMHNMILDTANGKCPSMYQLVDGVPHRLDVDASGNPFSVLEGRVAYVANICSTQAVALQKQLRVLKEVHTLPAERWSDETNEYCNG